MWNSIAMWGGVAGVFVALFAIIILFLTRNNILDILDKDVLLFDKNFELKNQGIQQAMTLIDELDSNPNVKHMPEFTARAKEAYNALLCVLSDVRLTDEFYNITITPTEPITKVRLTKFKLACRHDIGLRVKNTKALKRASEQENNFSDQFGSYTMDNYSRDSFSMPLSSPVQQPVISTPIAPPIQPAPAAPPAPKAPARPVPKTTMAKPVAQKPISQAQPTTPVKPMPRPQSGATGPSGRVLPQVPRPQMPTRRKPSSDDDKI